MRNTIWAAMPLALLALAAPAAAKDGARATTYKARLAPVAAEAPAAEAAKHGKAREGDKARKRQKASKRDRAERAGVRGKAELVDGGRRDKVRVRVRGLSAGETYSWSVRKAAEGEDACAGE